MKAEEALVYIRRAAEDSLKIKTDEEFELQSANLVGQAVGASLTALEEIVELKNKVEVLEGQMKALLERLDQREG